MKTTKIQKDKFAFILKYTMIYAVVCIGIFFPFIVQNKGFIWKEDGLFQTYSAMVYVSEYYKSILISLLHGSFNPAMVDFKIGLGYDVFTTLNYYGLGDPLLFLSVFFDKNHMYLFYNIVFLMRLYLAGIGFILFCFKMNKSKFPVLIGSIIYVFCGFAIVAGERHPYFLNAMVYLPFLLIGVEQILHKKKSYLFTIMIFISVISNYYFFYMLTIIVFLYALVRFVDIYRKEWKESIINVLLRGVIQYLIGIMLAAFALIPTIIAFLNNARGSSSTYQDGILYKSIYYKKLVYAFFCTPLDVDGNFTYLAYAPICMIAVIFLFFYRENFKKHYALKVIYFIAGLMLLTPVAGYIMNGMSYPSNRWIFGFSFLNAFMVASVLEDLIKLSVKKIIPMVIFLVLLSLPYFIMDTVNARLPVIGVAYLVAMVVIFMIIVQLKSDKIKFSIILLTTMIAVITFGYYYNAPGGTNYSEDFRENGKALAIIENCPQVSIPMQEDDTFYRVGSYRCKVENQALILGYYGIGSYYSLVDANILKYMLDMEINSLRQPHRFYGFDERTYLDALSGVKYYAFEQGSAEENMVPYGYQEVSQNKDSNSEITNVTYENQFALPIGFTYDKRVSEDYYNTLNSIQKQQVMLQAIVVEEATNQTKESLSNAEDSIKFSEQTLDYTLDQTNGITWDKEKQTIKVTDQNSNIRINIKAIKGCETYIRLVGLDIESSEAPHFNAYASTEKSMNRIYLTSSKYRWDLKRENYLINLGHNHEGDTSCSISFKNPGEYKLQNIEVYSLPMSDYESQVTKLKNEVLTDIQMSNNKITGKVNVSTDKALFFSVLYNAGWKLKVDGKETPLYKANTMYMAADISKGAHSIELTYATPGMHLGVLISLVTCCMLIIVFLFNKKHAIIQKN